ncbi:MAG: TetR/AcrR family transcriptional regulator [Acidimicrobiales bacterium]
MPAPFDSCDHYPVLEGLEDVRWASLTHAYGSAGDVPDLIRRLPNKDQAVREKALWEFPVLAEGLPAAPPPALDPVLDAVAICLAARGPSRTTMSDIARELRVAPSTVYRKVGSVDNAAGLLAAREAHAVLGRLPELVAAVEGPRKLTVFLAAGIRAAQDHPVFAKIMRDEPDFVGRAVTRRLPTIVDQSASLVAPFLNAAMDLGLIRRQDAVRLAHWVVRAALIILVAPPPGELETALDQILLPMIEP